MNLRQLLLISLFLPHPPFGHLLQKEKGNTKRLSPVKRRGLFCLRGFDGFVKFAKLIVNYQFRKLLTIVDGVERAETQKGAQ